VGCDRWGVNRGAIFIAQAIEANAEGPAGKNLEKFPKPQVKTRKGWNIAG
jgi:hypothetical protein